MIFYRMDGSKENIEKYTSEEKLKKLAEKFVTYFGGTFQCNIGQNVSRHLLNTTLHHGYFIYISVSA